MATPARTPRFRVALSFPGEKRDYVRLVAESLAGVLGRERVLYDDYLTAEFARLDLDLYLGALYRNESELVVPFYCAEYNSKKWCKLEWRQMRDILFNLEGHRIMPFRFDDAPIEGVLSLDGYVKIGSRTPAEVAKLILQRLDLLNPPAQSQGRHRLFISKLPSVNTLLIGRDDQLKSLDEAWANPKTNFVQIIAPGGTGKTALVDKWFRRHIGEADIFGWSFYSQGVSTQHTTSSDAFFAEIMGWLNIDLPATASVYAKADAVAERLRDERVLLILDGIEPLQDSSGSLRDSALKALLQELSTANEGLVLCTTRVRLDDFSDDPPRAVSIDLENLMPKYGAEYLRQLKVQGEEDELQQASRDCGNHALALTLLGTYLADFMEGDIRRRVEIREFMVDELKYGAHARRMMAAYERMFAGKPEAAILRALGFFNHPAEPEALKLVLPAMGAREYRAALNRVHSARLVVTKDPRRPVDCHPLIREHFAAVMRSTDLKAFQEGHSRLYEYYCQQAPYQPDTLTEMTPLFYAVYHGCQAGMHEKTGNTYLSRFLRNDAFYLTRTLGSYGTNLSLLANFFEIPWTQPMQNLSPAAQAFFLAEAGFSLRALGRLTDALNPVRSAAELRVVRAEWSNAARVSTNLSEIMLGLGQVEQAISAARQSVRIAERSGKKFLIICARVVFAETLLAYGKFIEAQNRLKEAELIQAELQPEYPILYSFQGFHYCDLLFEQGQSEEVIRRATHNLASAERKQVVLDIGLNHLSLGRACPPGSSQSVHHLNQAVDFLRQSGTLDNASLGPPRPRHAPRSRRGLPHRHPLRHAPVSHGLPYRVGPCRYQEWQSRKGPRAFCGS